MARCDKLESHARRNPKDLSFSELCKLAECWGYIAAGGAGSHVKYKHPALRLPAEHAMQVFQDAKGKAKPYQVRQMISAIDYIRENHPDYEP